MSCSSDQSEPSTSDSEDEFMDQAEYERRRELYLSKIIFCERKYHEIKPALLKLRLEQLEKLQDSILNRKSDIYLSRKAALDTEFEAKRTHIKIVRQLRLEALQRRVKADRWNAFMNLKNNKALARSAIQEAIDEKCEKLAMEQKKVERISGLCFITDQAGFKHTSKISPKDMEDKYLSKKTSNGTPHWCNIPVLIAQLPKHKITEDLDLFKAKENFEE
uniref:Uncharacterized protein n=1 Tax=Ditylenchus dipsaci TaxID=166011 RepID=A0A915EQF8_9BILA